mmetsp:Transcript_11700/g.27072  ORF Transcript_11700/g.27072 Transcript_11700/m.27072 type:complete len:244 (-) Transcript_11700:342-1073(-)
MLSTIESQGRRFTEFTRGNRPVVLFLTTLDRSSSDSGSVDSGSFVSAALLLPFVAAGSAFDLSRLLLAVIVKIQKCVHGHTYPIPIQYVCTYFASGRIRHLCTQGTYTTTMTRSNKRLRLYASFLGSSGIALGAFGAHALKGTLEKNGSIAYWNTAVLYQLVNAVALLGLSSHRRQQEEEKDKKAAAVQSCRHGDLIMVGTVLFSGSLYGMALGIGPKALLGPTTPIGGILMLCGWVALGFSN